ncbi:hypothetical protein [Ralstonia sp. ASV6]|uniref:hypothetical protein n=1 Tax=Ralstonia sp. ASV6 TaxID=2795124 RepID=UPI0018EDB708|nr:hypothetical protein [Ralstonia sp. ASV6]
MLASERHAIAQRTVSRLGEAAPLLSGAGWGEQIASRIVTAIAAVDAMVMSAEGPVLIADVVPGVDILAARDFTKPAAEAAVGGVSLQKSWVAGDIGADWIDALGKLAHSYLGERAAAAKHEGVVSMEGQDGVYYFAFQSQHRATVLRQVGLGEDELILVETGMTAGD